METLFQTPHGSRLYGLAHSDSDEDWYTVVSKVRTNRASYSTHRIVDAVDSVVVDFGTWIDLCTKGVPQALEAMFSQQATVDEIGPFRTGFHVGTEVYSRYLRTIKSFCLANDDSFKHKRHGLRLALNLKDIRQYGRFNPTLTSKQIIVINSLAQLPEERVYELAKQLAWSY